MKVRFLVTNLASPSGVVRTVYTLAGQLAREHQVEVVGVYTRGGKGLHKPPKGVRLRSLVDLSTTRTARGARGDTLSGPARRWLQERPSRLVHPHDTRYENFNLLTDLALLRYLRRETGGVMVSTRAGLNVAMARYGRASVTKIAQEHLFLNKYHPSLREAMRTHYRGLDLVVPLTERDADEYRALLGGTAQVRAVPNAVPDMRGARSGQTEKVVLAAGRLTNQKGWDRLVPAFALMAAEHPDWTLRMFTKGKPGATRRLHQRIAAHGLTDRVEVRGFTRDLPGEMERASLFALSSRFEGFPMVLLEAMSTGLVPVAFDCPNGPAEMIEDGTSGLLVREGDVEALGQGLSGLAADEERRREMSAAAVAAVERYSAASVRSQWQDAFAQAQQAHAGRGSRRS